MPDSPNIKRLSELINGTSVPAAIAGEYAGPERRLAHRPLIYKGGTEGHCLYFGDDAAVQRSFLKAGTKFEEHTHGSTEVVVVLSGVFHTTTAFITAVTPVAGVIVFPPGIAHAHVAETDCWVVGILIPSEIGYPRDDQ